MKVAILGSGPSVREFFDCEKEYDKIIGCNSFILLEWFRKLKNAVYVVHESRIIGAKFLNALKKFENDCFLTTNLINTPELKDILILMKEHIFDIDRIIFDLSIIKDYKKKIPLMADLQRNVIIDYSIPLALYLDTKQIDFYGCDFNYLSLEKPSYYHKKGTIGQFVHTKETAITWRDQSLLRFNESVSFLKAIGISTNRIL